MSGYPFWKRVLAGAVGGLAAAWLTRALSTAVAVDEHRELAGRLRAAADEWEPWGSDPDPKEFLREAADALDPQRSKTPRFGAAERWMRQP